MLEAIFFTLREEIYYGLCGKDDSILYIADLFGRRTGGGLGQSWTIAKITHCDISPGNIQIHRRHGILADWEYAVSVNQLHTAKVVNSVGFDC
jgi:hypothetical protein